MLRAPVASAHAAVKSGAAWPTSGPAGAAAGDAAPACVADWAPAFAAKAASARTVRSVEQRFMGDLGRVRTNCDESGASDFARAQNDGDTTTGIPVVAGVELGISR